MSTALSLPYDEIATVQIFAITAGGNIVVAVPRGTTVASDDPAIAVQLAADGQSYTATATARRGSAAITITAPRHSTVPPDVARITIVDPIAAVAVLTQDTANARFAPNPDPPGP